MTLEETLTKIVNKIKNLDMKFGQVKKRVDSIEQKVKDLENKPCLDSQVDPAIVEKVERLFRYINPPVLAESEESETLTDEEALDRAKELAEQAIKEQEEEVSEEVLKEINEVI